MRVALQGLPHIERPLPEGMVKLRINPESGLLVDPDSGIGVEEVFMFDNIPGTDRTFDNPNRFIKPGSESTPQPQGLPEHIF